MMTNAKMDLEIESQLKVLVQKKSSPNSVTILLLSILAFISFGLFKNSPTNILVLVAVLFIHEFGHSFAMRAFRYRDPNMLFIPIRGAIISGKEVTPSSSRQAIVVLAGPLPGIIIGVLFGAVYLKTGQEILIQTAKTFLIINSFNLLPVYPLDGGQFVNAALFSGNRKFELAFQFTMGLVLVGLSVLLKKPFFALLALIVLFSTVRTFLMSSAAETIRRNMPEGQELTVMPPLSCIRQIKGELIRKEYFRRLSPKGLAAHVLDVWGRICRKPPTWGAVFGLFFIYLLTLTLGLFSFFSLKV